MFIYFSRKARWILWFKQALLKYAISANAKSWTHSYIKGQKITFFAISRTATVGGVVIWPSNTKQPLSAASQLFLT
jgi:hypothetical protein